MVTKTKGLPLIDTTGGSELSEWPVRGQAVVGPSEIDSGARAVVSISPGRAGTSELLLECGHVVRRRLAFCPPRRVICPSCRGSR